MEGAVHSDMDINPSDIDHIAAPKDINAATRFDDLRRLVRRHVTLGDIGPQPRSHRLLQELIEERRVAAIERAEHLQEQTAPSTTRGRALRRDGLTIAIEERDAYARLWQALEHHCASACLVPPAH